MAGFESHDKKIAGNRQLVESYDKAHGKKSKHMSDAGKSDKHMEHSAEHGGGDDMKSIVAEHGKAHTHTITKDRETGSHHSETHHEDGHVAHADHGSLDEAHAHGMEAMGDDGEHNEMEPDDAMVAAEQNEEEMHGGKTSHVGFM
jgi:hypothetical protein